MAVSLDMSVLEMHDEETLAQLRAIRAESKIILTSSYSETEPAERFTGKGMAGFLQKPYEPLALLDRIRQAVDRVA